MPGPDPQDTIAPGGATSGLAVAVPTSMPAGFLFAGRFRIERLLGAGGMGAVYKAWDDVLGIPVALKVIRPEIALDQTIAGESEQRFKQELLLARRVSHRNVIRIHDLGDSGGIKFITMPFVEGTDLAAMLRAGRLPFARTLSLAKQLTAGLQAAHEVSVIHRDLKPQNILIDGQDTLYICDFGLAGSVDLTVAGLTRAGVLMGTPRYISPEQLTGSAADHRSDIYALGLILYEMATGQLPYTGTTAMEVMFQRVQTPPRDPQLLAPDLPEYFRRVVLRCLERQPDGRYQSAGEILADLEAGRAAALPAGARTVSITLPSAATVRRPLIGAVIFVLIAAGAIVWTVARRPASAPPAAAAAAAPARTVRLAVLPFRIVGDQSELAPVAVGVAEALSAKLFDLPGVTVSSEAAVQQLKADTPLVDVARTLGVPVLIAGTVQGSGNSLRVTVAVDDAAAGTRIWARDFTGMSGDLLTIQDQIYNGVVGALKLSVTTEQLSRAVVHPTENVAAYQLYLRGRNAMRGQQNPKNVEAALDFYAEALKRDPMFALAYAGIADAAVRMYRTTKEAEWSQKALSAAQQAQQLDDKLVEVHLALASVYQATGKGTEAIAILTAAAELAPGSDDVFRRLGRAYLASGRGNEAVDAYRKAIAINPYYGVSYGALGFTYMQLGRYAEAAESYSKMTEIDPRNVNGPNDLGAAYLQMGRYDAAVQAFAKALALQPMPQTYTNMGIAYAYAGKYGEAMPMFEKAVALAPNNDQWLGNLGDGYRWAGQAGKAADAYDSAIALALKALQVNPRDAVVRSNLAVYYAKRGDVSQARKLIAAARAINQANVDVMYAQATIEALGGRPADAIAALEQAFAAGYPLQAARSDPDLRSVVSDPQFTRVAATFGSTSK